MALSARSSPIMALATGWAALSTGSLVRGLEIHDNFFHRQVCCRCRENNPRDGEEWPPLVARVTRAVCQKSTTKAEESH